MKFIISSSIKESNFSELKDPAAFLDGIRKSEISVEEARHKQEEFDIYLKKKKKKKNKGDIFILIILIKFIINNIFNGRNDDIKYVDDYGSMILEGKKKSSWRRT